MGNFMRWLRRLVNGHILPDQIPFNGHLLVVDISSKQQLVTFAPAQRNVVFTSFDITDPTLFQSKNPPNGKGKSVSYQYLGSSVSQSYRFSYTTDDSHLRTGGGGDGTIQNS